MARLTLKNVGKSFGAVEVLHGIDIDIADGEFLALVGPSGCGKSTLLRVIAGLDSASSGDLLIDGRRINDVPPADRGIGMVFQSYALYPHMTVAQNISFGLRIRGERRDVIEARVREVAETLQLTPYLDRKPKALSGGQRQRVAIGRALIQTPSVFLFDEPLSNLDAKLRISMRVEISRLHRKLGSTSVYVTHDQVEALTMADRIAVLSGGRVEQIGSPLELYHRPATLFVAGFIGSPRMNFFPGQLVEAAADRAKVRLRDGAEWLVAVDAQALRPGSQVTVGIRPEHVLVGAPRGASGLGANALGGTIEVAEHLGEQTYLHVTVPTTEELCVVKVLGTPRLGGGDRLSVIADPDSCHLFGEDGAACPRVTPDGGGFLAADASEDGWTEVQRTTSSVR